MFTKIRWVRFALVLIGIISISSLSGCATTSIRATGVANIKQRLSFTTSEQNGLAISTAEFYNSKLTMEYYDKDFTTIGIVPIFLSVKNNSNDNVTIFFNESSLKAIDINDGKVLITRKIMERLQESVYTWVVPSYLVGGLVLGADMAESEIGAATIRNDKMEAIIIRDKLDPKIRLKPGETVDGVLFFDGAIIGVDNKPKPIKNLINPILVLVMQKDSGERSEISLNIKTD